jgi:CO dehydrogenase maturation factor
MSTTIAIAGKGGTGKTTISALLIKLLSEKEPPVLAVDGDPSTNLHQALGLPLDDETNTIGGIRESVEISIAQGTFPPGVVKQDYLDGKIFEGLVEFQGIDLLAMGRSEGKGCYCAVNHMLRSTMNRLSKNYRYVVIDNEAGMEHISRQTTQDVVALFIISNPTVPGISVAIRTKKLIHDLRSNIGKIYLIVNRVGGLLPSEIEEMIESSGLELIGTIPEDPNMKDFEAKGIPYIQLPSNSPLRIGVREIAKKAGLL